MPEMTEWGKCRACFKFQPLNKYGKTIKHNDTGENERCWGSQNAPLAGTIEMRGLHPNDLLTDEIRAASKITLQDRINWMRLVMLDGRPEDDEAMARAQRTLAHFESRL